MRANGSGEAPERTGEAPVLPKYDPQLRSHPSSTRICRDVRILPQLHKKLAGGAAGGFGEFGEGAVYFFGDEGGGVGDVGGFAAFAAVGDGSEEGGVGFEHETAEWGGADGFADGGGVFEGGDAGEADEM